MRISFSAMLTVCVLSAAGIRAQSLAEVAKKTEEQRAKRAEDKKTPVESTTSIDEKTSSTEKPASTKVYTNKDLKEDHSTSMSTASVPAETSTVSASGNGATQITSDMPGATDEAAWRSRMTRLRSQLLGDERSEAGLASRIADLRARYNAIIDSNRLQDGRATIFGTSAASPVGTEMVRLESEQKALREKIQSDKAAVAGAEEDARKAGVPPGWLRP